MNRADTLERTLEVVEEKFGSMIPQMKWINFGGGHHISRSDYDVERLCRIIQAFCKRHPQCQVYLEPGEAIALHAGVLVASVLDVFEASIPMAILDNIGNQLTCRMYWKCPIDRSSGAEGNQEPSPSLTV